MFRKFLVNFGLFLFITDLYQIVFLPEKSYPPWKNIILCFYNEPASVPFVCSLPLNHYSDLLKFITNSGCLFYTLHTPVKQLEKDLFYPTLKSQPLTKESFLDIFWIYFCWQSHFQVIQLSVYLTESSTLGMMICIQEGGEYEKNFSGSTNHQW